MAVPTALRPYVESLVAYDVDRGAPGGYADQSHLSRDWPALAGCSPTTWLREEFPFLHDRDVPARAG